MEDPRTLIEEIGALRAEVLARLPHVPVSDGTQRVFDDIAAERDRQRRQWGDERDDAHTDLEWLTLHIRWLGRMADRLMCPCPSPQAHLEMLHAGTKAAAVLVAHMEAIDRKLAGHA
ncbi:MAG: hypothetical protein OXG44_15865 [Gammaproteobacteria bacterium]|nr:hypothetical protein [Gammaproteobacteria bacterium]